MLTPVGTKSMYLDENNLQMVSIQKELLAAEFFLRS
jgi:hypothetical protein